MQKINLFVSHYQCGDSERQKEIDFCFNHNKESGLFSSIINFSDRPTYNDFFKYTKDYPSDINILANADIYFNSTINFTHRMSKNDCYALTRWELNRDNKVVSFSEMHVYNNHAKPEYSQDVWVIVGAARNVSGDFHIGKRGCDNRIAHELIMAGYNVTNPSDVIKCVHLHRDEKRNYTMPETVPRPYKFIKVGSKDMKPTRKNI